MPLKFKSKARQRTAFVSAPKKASRWMRTQGKGKLLKSLPKKNHLKKTILSSEFGEVIKESTIKNLTEYYEKISAIDPRLIENVLGKAYLPQHLQTAQAQSRRINRLRLVRKGTQERLLRSF